MPEPVSRRPDRLVCLLGVPDLLLEGTRGLRQVLPSKLLADLGTSGPYGSIRQRGAVGPHVGDVPLLVQALGGVHRHRGRHLQAPAGLLLVGGGDKGCSRSTPVRLRLNRSHFKGATHETGCQTVGCLLVEDNCTLAVEDPVIIEVTTCGHTGSVDLGQHRGERFGRTVGHLDLQVPVAGCLECHALTLSLHDDPGCHALDTASRQALGDHLPENR